MPICCSLTCPFELAFTASTRHTQYYVIFVMLQQEHRQAVCNERAKAEAGKRRAVQDVRLQLDACMATAEQTNKVILIFRVHYLQGTQGPI